MSLDDLPAGLPPGWLVTPDPRFRPEWTDGPVCWASQEPLPDAPQQWARLQAIQDRTGLRPILFWPNDAREPCHPSQIDALDAETILLREWHELERLRRQGVFDSEYHRMIAAETPNGVEVPPYDPGPPFATWPGLAPPGAGGRDPEVVAREVVGRQLLPRMLTFAETDLYLGWSRPPAAPTSPRSSAGPGRPMPCGSRSCRRCCAPGSSGSAPGWWRCLTSCTSRWPPRRCVGITPST